LYHIEGEVEERDKYYPHNPGFIGILITGKILKNYKGSRIFTLKLLQGLESR